MQILPDNPGYQLTANSISQDWTITGAGGVDEWTVRSALLATVPPTNAPPSSGYAWPIRSLSLKEREASTGVWKFSITWGVLSYQVSGKIGGQQQQIRANKQITDIYGTTTGAATAWTNGAAGTPIGWDGRTVHGCSIYVPQETWTESVEIPIGDFTPQYKQTVRAVARKPVNLTPFRGLQENEVLFLGFQYQVSTQNPDFVSASFEFSASPNYCQSDGSGADSRLTIDGIGEITKNGWDYLDAHYAVAADPTNPVLIPKADYVITHRVYWQSDFSGLNIGTDDALPVWQGT
jgi:hypothetical protein